MNLSDEEEEDQCKSIKTFDVALTLTKDLLLFLEEKGEEKAAEAQQSVVSALQDAKLRKFTKQTNLYDFMHQS